MRTAFFNRAKLLSYPACLMLLGILSFSAETFADTRKAADLLNMGKVARAARYFDQPLPASEVCFLAALEAKKRKTEEFDDSCLSALQKGLLLHFAAARGELVEAKALIAAGADLHTEDENGWTPLHTAVRYGQPAIVEQLIAAGADLNAKQQRGCCYSPAPIHIAIRYGRTEEAKLLLQAGADPNVLDGAGWPALHIAAARGETEIVKALVEAGSDISLKHFGQTAYDSAVKYKKYDIASFLYGEELEAARRTSERQNL